jgi:amino acid adenylation domain-containing protein
MLGSMKTAGAIPDFLRNEAIASLADAEKQKLLVEWNQTKVDYPRDKCLHELFQTEVQHTPEAVAVVFKDQQLTYLELNERANRLANHLRNLGVKPETLVGLFADRSAEYVVCVLAILKAGGAYVPLDTDYPVERLQFMLVDSGVPVVVADQSLPKDLSVRGITVVNLTSDARLIQACPKRNLNIINSAENLAYVIYTSGSTGQPKGVAVPHRGVVRLVRGQNYVEFDDRRRFLLHASTSFDAATFEMWGPLLNGAVCVILSKQPLDFQKLETVIRQHEVTCLFLTTGLFNQIIDARPSILETVQHVLTGGEVMSVSRVQKAMQLLPRLQLANIYGPTESTTFACFYAIKKEVVWPASSMPIGRPIANTTFYILDNFLQPVPIGVAGELHIGGDGLARGYHNRPELTAEKFIADPFSPEPGARLYKTGDLARYLPDGNIEFLGRIDHQVKIRGFRIELGEIEAVLGRHPNILNVVVIAREDVPDHKHLVAYLVIRQEPAPTGAELRDFLLQRLPNYMVPVSFITLTILPLTPNGKIDRKALPAPNQSPIEMRSASAIPETALEQSIASIWQDVLHLPVTELDHNFFDIGGDSIRIASVHDRLQKLLGRQFPITDLFAHTTIRSLAGYFNSSGNPNSTVDALRVRARQQRQSFSAQRNMRHNKQLS